MRRKPWFTRTFTRPPYHDEIGSKGRFERFSRAQPHLVRHLALKLPHWPRFSRPLRVAFLADLHVGSHAGDVGRLSALLSEAQGHKPDLVLYGGDYVNMQPFGGGRIAPRVIAKLLGGLEAPLGRFAVLGNHDYDYGGDAVASALRECGIDVIDDERRIIRHEGTDVAIAGIPDAHIDSEGTEKLLAGLRLDEPAIILAHDPYWFAHVRSRAHVTLAGHTHGGQFRLPLVGALRNASRAPLRWTHGHIVEEGRHLFVTAGIGTSALPLRIGVPPDYAIIDIGGEDV